MLYKKRILGPALLLITAILWGLTFVSQKMGSDYVEPYTFNAGRFLISGVLMLPIYLITSINKKRKQNEEVVVEKEEQITKNNKRIKLILTGISIGLLLFIGATFQQIGITLTKNASKTGFISATYIVFVPIFCMFIYKEKIKKIIWLYLAVSMVGFFLISVKENFEFEIGDLFTLISALGYAGQISLISRIANDVPPLYLSFVQFMICGVLSLLFAFIFNTPKMDDIIKAIPAIMFAAIFSGCIAFTLQIYGQKYTDPTIASMIMSLESVFSLIFRMIILNELLTTKEFIGSMLIFASIILAQIDFKELSQKRRKSHATT